MLHCIPESSGQGQLILDSMHPTFPIQRGIEGIYMSLCLRAKVNSSKKDSFDNKVGILTLKT